MIKRIIIVSNTTTSNFNSKMICSSLFFMRPLPPYLDFVANTNVTRKINIEQDKNNCKWQISQI